MIQLTMCEDKKLKLVKRRRCQNILDDGLFSGVEKKCDRLLSNPNKFLCNTCLKKAESIEQCLGTGEK